MPCTGDACNMASCSIRELVNDNMNDNIPLSTGLGNGNGQIECAAHTWTLALS